MRGSRKFCQRGSNSENVFFFVFFWVFFFFGFFIREESVQIAQENGHHWPHSRADGGPTLNAGLVAL